MALKEGWPAIRAEWLWKWLQRGTVEAVPLLGLPELGVLAVSEHSRPWKTWYREQDGRVIKHETRYWLGEGILLVNRWDPLDRHFDPIADKGIEDLSPEQLRERGMYRLEDGTIVLLICQHVEDALHFQRQQWHIRLETYKQELEEISDTLAKIEGRVTEEISSKEAGEDSLQGGVLGRDLRRRREEIHQILVHAIAPREQAAGILVNTLWRELSLAEKGIKASFSSKPMKDFLAGKPVSEGLRAHLVRIYHNLDQMKVRPVVKSLKRIQHRLRGALGALDVGEREVLKQNLNLVLADLREARELLKQPAEKVKGLKASTS